MPSRFASSTRRSSPPGASRSSSRIARSPRLMPWCAAERRVDVAQHERRARARGRGRSERWRSMSVIMVISISLTTQQTTQSLQLAELAQAPVAPARVRASAQAAPSPDRLDRPGRGRAARRRAREALDQEGREGLGARAGDPLLRPDHARGPGHARQGLGALLEGDPARSERPERPVGRGGLRLPESRADGRRAPRGSGVKVASVATAFPSGQSPIGVKVARPRRRSRSAPTRSTW